MFRNNLNILVVGDLMMDVFSYGSVNRISPEAPVPVFDVNGKSFDTLGGAGNVVNNLVSLGFVPDVVGAVGDDYAGRIVLSALQEKKINTELIQMISNRRTSVKTRLVAGSHHVIRIDDESTDEIEYTKKINKFYDVAIISDYAKGVISKDLLMKIISKAEYIILDPHPKNASIYNLMDLNTIDLITPNIKEAEQLTRLEIDGYLDTIRKLLRSLCICYANSSIITDGDNGMYVYSEEKFTRIPAEKVEVFDVSGAGDTVVSVLASALASEYSLIEAAKLANKAAGIVVSKSGTSTVSLEDLKR